MSRSPRGGRGLKLSKRRCAEWTSQSLPSRGAWIETSISISLKVLANGRSPRGGRGLKLGVLAFLPPITGSLPSRGAWIETESGECV